MKLKIMLTTGILVAGLANTVYAGRTTLYYPPERIDCVMNVAHHLECYGYNQDVLVQDVSTVDLPVGGDVTAHFSSAVAYLTPDHSESSIFFTYRDTKQKMVRLKTLDAYAKPVWESGHWKKINDEIYTCDSGYMNCSINLS